MTGNHSILSGAICLALIAALLPACSEDDSDPTPTPANNDPMPEPEPEPEPEAEPEPEPMPDVEPEPDPTLTMCGGFVPRGDSATLEECAACVVENCCDEATACGEDPDCLALRQCFAACDLNDGDCEDVCTDMLFTEETGELNGPMVECRRMACTPLCSAAVDLTCLGDPPPQPNAQPREMRVFILLQDFQFNRPVEGAEVKLCAIDDELCENPIVSDTTDERGNVGGTLVRGPGGFEEGFVGYIEVTGSERLPTRHFIRDALQINPLSLRLRVLSETSATAALAILGAEQDPERSAVIWRMTDCARNAARDALLDVSSTDEQSASAYLVNGFPNTDATETGTDGEAYFFNVPVGNATLTATQKADGVKFFEEEISLRAGFATSIARQPNQ